MSNRADTGCACAEVSEAPMAAAPAPDVNAETYPYELVQYLLDQVANFVLLAVPDPRHGESATLTPGDPRDFFGINGGYGLDIASLLHRFEAEVAPAQAGASGGVQVNQIQQLFLLARTNGKKSPEDWARATWDIFAPQGRALVREGKPLTTPEENLAELTSMARNFANKYLPVLIALGVAE